MGSLGTWVDMEEAFVLLCETKEYENVWVGKKVGMHMLDSVSYCRIGS